LPDGAMVFQEYFRCPKGGKKVNPLSPDRTGDIRRSCFEPGSGDYNATLFQLSYERNWIFELSFVNYFTPTQNGPWRPDNKHPTDREYHHGGGLPQFYLSLQSLLPVSSMSCTSHIPWHGALTDALTQLPNLRMI
jgi:hypothetical protein